MNPNLPQNKQTQRAYEDNQEFNNWLDEEYGGLEVTDDNRYYFYKTASEILFYTDNDLYWEIYNLQSQIKQEVLVTEVIDSYPTPIAFYMYQVVKGYENHGQRLRYLRDIWESLTYLLYAIVLGEAISIRLPLGNNSLNMDKILSDKISTRLNVIDTILTIAKEKRIEFVSAHLIPDELIPNIKKLNRVRNEFSHNFTEDELRARETFQKYVGDVYTLLAKAAELSRVSIFRLGKDIEDYSKPRCLIFKGGNLHSSYDEINLEAEQISFAVNQKVLHRKNILAIVENRLFSLSPFLYFKEGEGPTRPCFYKQKVSGNKYSYAVTGQSEPTDFPRAIFQDQLDVLRTLLNST